MFENIKLPTKLSVKSSAMKIEALGQKEGKKRGKPFKWHLEKEDEKKEEKGKNNLGRKESANHKYQGQNRISHDLSNHKARTSREENGAINTIDIII